MSTLKQPLQASFSPAMSGQVGNVHYTVFDADGVTIRIPRTTTGITEETDAAGSTNTGTYLVDADFDPTWNFPVRVKWDISGQAGQVAEETIMAPNSGGTVTIVPPQTVRTTRYDSQGALIAS